MSDFFGLRVALSALHAQRRAMEVSGHNVANANTEGYSRQRVNTAPDPGPITPARWSRWERGGQGVEVVGTDRLRNAFLEARSHQEHAADASLRRTSGVLGRVETAFGEPGDNGVAAQLADFWAGWDDVANHPEDLSARTQLLERAKTVAGGLNAVVAQLAGTRTAAVEQMRTTVAEVNATAARVADLNRAVRDAVRNGLSPNDLADQRDLLVAKLADAVGVTARPAETGQVDVYLNGTALVRGDAAVPLTVVEAPGAVALRFDNGSTYTFTVDGGDVGGNLKVVNDVLPRYSNQVDDVANRLRSVVDGLHAGGRDLDGNPGVAFFAPGTGAATLALAPAVAANPRLVAAAAPPPADRFDGANALRLAEAATDPAGPDQAYRSLIVGLGVESQTVGQRVAIQGQLTAQIDTARDAEAGVSLDEEMTNMVAFQHAYEAAAKFMTAVDQMLDTLVNRTGVVGR